MRWRKRSGSGESGFDCTCCGQHHAQMPLAFHSPAPAGWLLHPELEADPDSELGSDQCVIRGEEFYIRGLIQVPVRDDARVFEWSVWVSLSHKNFTCSVELWTTPGRESAEAMFGWLNTALPTYTSETLNLKTMVHTRQVGHRPLVVLEPTDHRLAVEQRDGITVAVLEQRVAQLMHPS